MFMVECRNRSHSRAGGAFWGFKEQVMTPWWLLLCVTHLFVVDWSIQCHGVTMWLTNAGPVNDLVTDPM